MAVHYMYVPQWTIKELIRPIEKQQGCLAHNLEAIHYSLLFLSMFLMYKWMDSLF